MDRIIRPSRKIILPNMARRFGGYGGGGSGGSGVTAAVARKEAALQKTFFGDQALLPPNALFEALSTFQAVDFQNLNGGSKTISMSRARVVTGGGGGCNFGWDIGSAKSKVLALCHFRQGTGSAGIFISGTAQASASPVSGYHVLLESVSSSVVLYKVDGASAYTSIGSETEVAPLGTKVEPTIGLALYYDDTTDRLIVFVRFGAETWFPVIDITDATYTTMRYVMVAFGVAGVVTMWAECPVAVYTS